MALTGRQNRYLRSLGHHLTPLVRIGHGGVTPGVLQAVDQALTDHELIKVKVSENAPDGRRDVARLLAGGTHAEEVQVLGRTLLLYRAHPDKPTIQLPRTRPAAEPPDPTT